MDAPAALVRVTSVRVLARYFIEIGFADGTEKVIDLEPHLWGEMFQPLVDDYALFRAVRVDPASGTIGWPNGADLSPRMLHTEAKATEPA